MKSLGSSQSGTLRRWSHLWLVCILCAPAALYGCEDEGRRLTFDATPDALVPDGSPPDASLQPCDPALGFDVAPGYANPRRLAIFMPSGGSGVYRFEMAEKPSGGEIDSVTGAYVAGGVTDVTDIIRLTDVGCTGEVTTPVQVVPSMRVLPEDATVTPMSSYTFIVQGGSGSTEFTMNESSSGGTVDRASGEYVAGASTGIDTVRVRDLETTEEVVVRVVVDATAGLAPSTARLVLPIGTSVDVPVVGGSSIYDASPTAGSLASLSVDGDRITGVSAGEVIVTVSDRFADFSIEIPVRVVAASQDSPFAAGTGDPEFDIEVVGDLNGDGFEDAVAGSERADGDHYRSGKVWVLAGTAEGFNPTPVQVIHGDRRDARFGDSFVVGDLNGDGEADLAVGAWNSPGIRSQSGYIDVYLGEPGGFFQPVASQRLHAARGGDQLGRSLALCDFNADGYLDLAAGAISLEDYGVPIRSYSQGGVNIYLGSASGLPTNASQFIYGMTHIDGAWTGYGSLQVGREIVAGDFTGDGACDLAVYGLSPYRYLTPSRSNNGAVMMYRGVAATPTTGGGVESLPYRAFIGVVVPPGSSLSPSASWLGREMAAEDLNDDGRVDLVVSEYLADPEGRTDAGAVHVFLSPEDTGEISPGYEEAASASDFSLTGSNRYDYFGGGLSVADLDGDGIAEIAIGALVDEDSALGIADASGIIHVYQRESVDPLRYTELAYTAGERGDRLGATTTIVPGKGIFGYAYWTPESALGHRVGRLEFAPYMPPLGETAASFGEPADVALGGTPSGALVGFSIAIIPDQTNDGRPDLLVGAPSAETDMTRGTYSDIDVGGAYLYPGTDTGFDTSSAPTKLVYFDHLRGGDRGGEALGSVGDFDGDGRQDFAIVSRLADRGGSSGRRLNVDGSSSSPRDDVVDRCAGANQSNIGGAFIFLGTPSGPPTQPSFVAYATGAGSNRPTSFSGGFDFNGDGRDDFVMGMWDANSRRGRVILVQGRPTATSLPPNKTIDELCTERQDFEGAYNDQRYGYAVTVMGDIDGDGCDEFAVGAPRYGTETSTAGTQGAAYIHFGYSSAAGSSCASSSRTLVLLPGTNSGQAGTSLSAGDFDGDSIPDLAVGAPFANADRGQPGRAFIALGSYIRAHAPSSGGAPQIVPLLDPEMRGLALDGASNGARFGWALSAVPNIAGDSRTGLLVGAPRADVLGNTRTGSASAYRIIGTAASGFSIESTPFVLLAGESGTDDAEFGYSVAGGYIPTISGGLPVVGVGSPYSDALSLEWGASFAGPLSW